MATTLGGAREDMKKGQVPSGMTKDIFMEMKLEEAVVESDGFDLIVMGQPEGAGCYCAANSLLCNFLDRLQSNYPYIVMDNEAGMEHISRLTTNNIDLLLVVSDTSRRSIQAAARIHRLANELKIVAGRSVAVINQVKEPPPETVLNIFSENGLELIGTVPSDEMVYEYDLKGRPTVELPDSSRSVQAAYRIFENII